MRKIRITFIILGILVILSVISASAASLLSEIKWIDGISGIKFITGVEKDKLANRRYTVNDDELEITRSIRSGLKKRGWNVGKDTVVETEDSTITIVKATKKMMKIEVVLRKSEAEGTMDVVIKGKPSKETTETPTTVTVPNAIQAGPTVMIANSNEKKTYNCNNTVFDINGAQNTYVLYGTCKKLRINGASNTVTIKGKVNEIYILGSSNVVYWSKKMNPTEPKITDMTQVNTIQAIP